MDDMWGTEVWDDFRRIFVDRRMGSRILLTTREFRVAQYANSNITQHHGMRLLNDAESWDLMRRIVFMSRPYHLEHLYDLEEVGKEIANKCKGLPLSIVVISGVLSNVSPRRSAWQSVADNINSNLLEDEQCSQLLLLNYDHLPHHLKPCFLYMGVFPEDFEIPVSKLVNLWIAEGFLKPSISESLEEVGQRYVEDISSRQLIVFSERSRCKIKTCRLHDLIREFCLRKAEQLNFFHASSSDRLEDPRRITCLSDFWGRNTIFSSVRSLISLSAPQVVQHCKLLRVLDMDKVRLRQFPNEIFGLVCLGYVALWCEEEEICIPKDICKCLQNLQILIILQSSNNNPTKTGSPGVHLPSQLWSMPKLRYLKFRNCYLPLSSWNISLLENLHTLSKLSSSSFDVNLFTRTPNLKKLGVLVENPFCLGNMGNNLSNLEKLQVIAERGAEVTISENFTLPRLKKLILNRTNLPWEDMKIVGSLPNLEELRLINNAFQGSEWELIEDGFRLLKSLTLDELDLEYWKADASHFPNLVHLSISECGYLRKISEEIGKIQTLETIMMDDASAHAVIWAKKSEEYHQENGTESFRLWLFNIWSNQYQQVRRMYFVFYNIYETLQEKFWFCLSFI
ncbi:hypothetical protein F511_24781 [Dorcoceras hygrometricum]|uniref:Uncharacterized protein n=1 Tax=Dorcoceras hygrometricum TaxID=472368 RepID=A0A2Z7CH19_9LAMI|nr:hypothetical protein F511_24781 [Dorcoceras hygrometricum]